MKYFLVIMIWAQPHAPVISQIGPFRDIFACEHAAAQATIFQANHPDAAVQTFCAAERVWGRKKK